MGTQEKVMSLYEDLGVTKDSTEEEFKKAYRKKAAQHHPDREGGSHEEFVKVKKAYEVLSDPEKRAHYDQTGEEEKAAGPNVYEIILNVFSQVAENNDVVHVNLLKVVSDHFKHQRRKANTDIEKLRRTGKKWRIVGRKIKVKTGANPVLNMANQKRKEICQQYIALRGARVMIDTAIEIMDGWEYHNETAPVQHHGYYSAFINI
jgi:DnaJ-class molecular chaperone